MRWKLLCRVSGFQAQMQQKGFQDSCLFVSHSLVQDSSAKDLNLLVGGFFDSAGCGPFKSGDSGLSWENQMRPPNRACQGIMLQQPPCSPLRSMGAFEPGMVFVVRNQRETCFY